MDRSNKILTAMICTTIVAVISIVLGSMYAYHVSCQKEYLALIEKGYTPLEASCATSFNSSDHCEKAYSAEQAQIILKAAKGLVNEK